jgi:hypothetical protein
MSRSDTPPHCQPLSVVARKWPFSASGFIACPYLEGPVRASGRGGLWDNCRTSNDDDADLKGMPQPGNDSSVREYNM